MNCSHVTVAITGASGSIYGVRLIEELLKSGSRLTVLISRAGFSVLKQEMRLDWSGDSDLVNVRLRRHFSAEADQLTFYDESDFHSPVASGSSAADAMLVAPCSMGSLARIASGISTTLIERSADVMLKERRPLLLIPRETPLSAIHLENMLKLSRTGALIIPAMPGFYGNPQTVDDIVNFVVGKVLDGLGIEHSISIRWG